MVNTEDVNQFQKSEIVQGDCIMDTIFKSQAKLLEKYREIEMIPRTIDFNNAEHQKILKALTFRGIEELAEAFEAIKSNEVEHYIEELSDALHFFTELCIITEAFKDKWDEMYKLENWVSPAPGIIDTYRIEHKLWNATYYYAISCNKLKNKPWKKTQILTDVDEYKKSVRAAYLVFLLCLSDLNFSGEDILKMYVDKNSVNHFRIRSNY